MDGRGIEKYVEWVPCDVCGQNNYTIVYPSRFTEKDFFLDRFKSFTYANDDKSRGNIVRCNNCALVYTDPRDKDVEMLYREVEDLYYFSSENDRKTTFERDVLQLEKLRKPWIGDTKRLLDVGCSYGFFLDVAKRRGWDVYGSELSVKQSQFAQQRHSKVYTLPLSECPFEKDYFDVVTLYDVIEHVTSPTALLREVHGVLKSNGILTMTTPDLASLSAKIMRTHWLNFVRMHFYYFTPKTIIKLLEKCGFTVVQIVRHRRVIKLGVAIQWMSKYTKVHKILMVLLGNRFMKNIKITTALSGNMVVYARKM